MTYDSFVTAAIAHEAQSLAGAFVDHITQPADLDLYVSFYMAGRKTRWVFSADARLARVHQAAGKPENPPTPPNFCMLLRKWIDGARLTAVHQVGFDRVLRWEFTRSDGDRALIAEVMGKHSNLILVDEADVILGAIKRVPASMSRVRQILPGLPYTPPPEDRLNPLTTDRAAFLAAVSIAGREASEAGAATAKGEEGLPECGLQAASPTDTCPAITITPKLLLQTLAGFGTFAAAEVLARAGSTDPEPVWAAVEQLATATRGSRFEPSVFYARPGDAAIVPSPSPDAGSDTQPGKPAPRGFWAFSSVQVPPEAQQRVATLSAAADTFFSTVAQASSETARRGELQGLLRKERERLERLARRMQEDLRRGDEVEQFKIAGELLASNLWQVERGQRTVEVANYYDPEQRPLTIELDPELTPQENVERLFRKYRKGTDAALLALEQSEKVSARLAAMRAWEARVAGAPAEALPELRQELTNADLGIARAPAAPGAGKKETERAAPEYPSGVRIRRHTVDGWEILVGENATSNDYLTTRVARPDDWWLHARAVPSSHVVIRTGGRPDRVPPAVLHEAARITAAHSEAKHSRLVPVDYVLKKHVRKPRGSPPGRVTHRGEKTLNVEPATGVVTR